MTSSPEPVVELKNLDAAHLEPVAEHKPAGLVRRHVEMYVCRCRGKPLGHQRRGMVPFQRRRNQSALSTAAASKTIAQPSLDLRRNTGFSGSSRVSRRCRRRRRRRRRLGSDRVARPELGEARWAFARSSAGQLCPNPIVPESTPGRRECVVVTTFVDQNRTAYVMITTNDKLGLSVIMCFIEKCPKSATKTPKLTLSRAPRRRPARRRPTRFPRPTCRRPSPPLPAHLQDLADRARDYVAAASSANTRRAYAADWKHFAAWCRRQNLSSRCRPIRRSSGSTSPPAPPATAERRRKAEHRLDHRAAPVVARPGTARSAACRSTARTAHIATVHGRHPQQTCRPAAAEGGDPAGRADRHAGDARPRHAARPARPRHAAARLCRRPAPLRNRRPRPRPRPDRRRPRLDRDLRQGPARDPARQDRLARGRDRPRLVRRHLPGRRRSKPGSTSPSSPTGRCSAASPARARRSAPTASTTRRWPASSRARRWPPACAAICPRANAARNLPATRCAPASPPRPRSTSATSRSSSATPRPR